jgi:hypothetical protein
MVAAAVAIDLDMRLSPTAEVLDHEPHASVDRHRHPRKRTPV